VLEAPFEHIACTPSTVTPDTCAEAGCDLRRKVNTEVYRSLLIAGGLKFDKSLKQPKQGLFAGLCAFEQV
jgi:hypothetical protein